MYALLAFLRANFFKWWKSLGGSTERLDSASTEPGNQQIPHVTRPRSLIALLGNAVTCITIVGPTLAYAWLTFIQLENRALEHAVVGARQVELDLAKAGTASHIEELSIGALHAVNAAGSTVVASWVTNEDGSVRMFNGRIEDWPEIEARAPIRGPGFSGYFYVSVSTESLILGTLEVALAFLILSVAAHYCFRRLPLAALDDALALLQQKQAELQAKNDRFDEALDHMSQGLCMFDRDQRILVCNKRYAEMYGLTAEQTKPGTTLREIVNYRVANGLYAGASPEEYMQERTARVVGASNTLQTLSDGRHISIARRPMKSGGWVTTHEDVTEQRKNEAKIAYMAHHDALTGLPNRVLLRQRLEEAIAQVPDGKGVAVHCLDLDRFKEVNDTLGHAIGDALLKGLAERLKHCVRGSDTVGRVSGDEFVVVQTPVSSQSEAMALAQRIAGTVDDPFVLNGHQIMVGTSIGIAMSTGEATDPETLLRQADLALYRAKSEQRGTYRLFEPEMTSRLQARRDMELALRSALQNGEFEIYYQPILNLAHNEVRGFEALLRWHRPGYGTVSPGEFIPLAEETGLIMAIGEWVLRTACAHAAMWPDNFIVSVNLSPVQFKSRNLIQTVVSALAAAGILAERLELEVTESILVQESEAALTLLRSLRNLGVRIALDDFGTGYSSLSYLQSFPFDKIKIDRSFIQNLASGSESAQAIIAAIVQLGSTLGIATTAEGVETNDQLEIVRAQGCTEIQGYLLSPPKPEPEIVERFCALAAKSISAA
ncbi:MAG: putative bifunctional diguanylate cyclase/phosphodiesterase [Bacteroidota bacterium]